MGNIEMLIFLEKDIKDYEKRDLTNEINKIPDPKIQKRVSKCIKEFVYLLENHMVRLIATLSDHIKNDPSRTKIKENLLNYSTSLVHMISAYVVTQLDEQRKAIHNLQENQYNLVKVKTALNEKIETLAKVIDQQNIRMQSLSGKLDAMLVRPSVVVKESDNVNIEGGANSSQSSDIIEEIFNVLPKSTVVAQPAAAPLPAIDPEKNAKVQTKKMSPPASEEVIMAPIPGLGNNNSKPEKFKMDISKIADSENGYKSESPNENQKAINYISSEKPPTATDKSMVGEIYNI
ncbi:MAG: hypothetical protein Hyperionvirus25_14 [Hyperionvirus sp.]|uniref:Uncharacterized protein n=1 Tax=Hyperionvirus sp. TaxID=2487770 RepID=A0A3G5AB15_9VIRU|nr:MAG: hypothetical protein Hyperionvirus25_14 [Hyperionvirus sp.]